MLSFILKKLVGTKEERDIKRLQARVERINSWEAKFKSLSDNQLRAKTDEFKARLNKGESLDDILEEAFAVVREAAIRTIGMRHFDVQLMGGIVLYEGKIAEMKTGEGKTLVATLPLYLIALENKGAHLVTVNDYLAKRDRYWMGPIYEFLGLKVGLLQHDMPHKERKEAYLADITYGTNNEFGFDYLRDHMVGSVKFKVQRGHHYAIVDEVDSILIDEARTPLIISGPAEESTDKYYKINLIVPYLKKDRDYKVDEKTKNAYLIEEGVHRAERLLNISNLYAPENMDLVHHINQALKAHALFHRDVDYLVKDGEVIIIDEFTGRLMPGRRYSDGLHQALEAKEGLKIKEENQTLATITLQNYFRMYSKLAGMTGTAATEQEEFLKIYNLEVVVIPTHEPMIRLDYSDIIYKTEAEKFRAVVDEIKELYKRGRPILVGTISVEKSERLSNLLKEEGIPHQVLNAKYHEKEAQIVANAGQPKTVTIATNMAGRGTDIILGANVANMGGLHIIGTERHEARRIDNQLRGRSGRQGDPGSSRFYLSLEDDLMRIFGADKIKGLMDRLGLKEGQVIESPLVTRAIERAQKQVEAHNFDLRKHLLEYDDVMNQQRQIIYKERDLILMEKYLKPHFEEILEEVIDGLVDFYTSAKDKEDWELLSLEESLAQMIGRDLEIEEDIDDREELKRVIVTELKNILSQKEEILGKEGMGELMRNIMLHVLDNCWKDHLYNLDHLKEGIHLRAYGQRDPLVEYKHEAYSLFDSMLERMKTAFVSFIYRVEPKEEGKKKLPSKVNEKELIYTKKVGRNQPCPCGSGKKYKFCHGR